MPFRAKAKQSATGKDGCAGCALAAPAAPAFAGNSRQERRRFTAGVCAGGCRKRKAVLSALCCRSCRRSGFFKNKKQSFRPACGCTDFFYFLFYKGTYLFINLPCMLSVIRTIPNCCGALIVLLQICQLLQHLRKSLFDLLLFRVFHIRQFYVHLYGYVLR